MKSDFIAHDDPMSSRCKRLEQGARVLGAAVLGALISSWPLAGIPDGYLLGAPGQENALHDWTLWIAAREGWVVDSTLANWPAGWRQVLADPLHLPAYRLGAAGGGLGSGFHLVQFVNLVAMGLTSGWLAGRRGAVVAALLAPTCCAASTFLHTGMTEEGTLWLAAAAVGAGSRTGRRWTWIAGGLLGLGAWGGPYTLVLGALGLLAVVWGDGVRAGVGRLIGIAVVSGILAAPVLWAITTQRPAGLPGSSAITLRALADPNPLAMRLLGTDPLAWVWPAGREAAVRGHGPYFGLPLLVLAGVGARRHRRLALGAAWLLVLSLGAYVQLGGRVPTVGGDVLSLPAGWIAMAVPPLARLGRWVRASVVAAVLLTALAGSGAAVVGARLGRWRWLGGAALAALVAMDGLVGGPIAWPRQTTEVDVPDAIVDLSPPGAVLVVPSRVPAGTTTARFLMWQKVHGQPIGANPMFGRDTEASTTLRRQLESVATQGRADRAAAVVAGLRDDGFRWVVHWRASPGRPTAAELEAVLGQPARDDGRVVVWGL